MKKLIPALAMLLVAACLMGTSTYAWFSASTSVTASGMNVKAVSDGGLAIATWKKGQSPVEPGENDFASAVTLDPTTDWVNGASEIKPTSWNGTDWFSGKSDSADSAAASELARLDNTDAARAGYMQHSKWSIKSLKDNVTVDVAVTSVTVTLDQNDTLSSASLNKALRVGIKVGTKFFIFAPSYTTEQAAKLTYIETISTTGAFSYTTSDEGENTYGTTTPSTTVFEALGTEAVAFDVYVYYEGQDENCKTAFATNIDRLNVTLGYEVV